jgi:hypothetical protein
MQARALPTPWATCLAVAALGLTWSSGSWAAHARSRATEGADFCVSGGAPVVGEPVIAQDSSVHFLTSDSYLHSYEADGRFRSSYTLDGGAEFGVGEREDGALFATTSRGGLYTWEVSGKLRFFRALGAQPHLKPVALGAGRIGFFGLPGQFWALGAWGETFYRVPVHGRPVLGPVEVGGQVWFARDNGVLVLEAAWRQHVFALPGAPRRLLSLEGKAPAYVVIGETLYQITHKSGIPLRIRKVAEHVLDVAGNGGVLAWVRALPGSQEFEIGRLNSNGEVMSERRLARAPVGPPLVIGERAYFPLGSEVIELGPTGERRFVLGTDPGRELVGRGALLATVRRGHLVCVLQLYQG